MRASYGEICAHLGAEGGACERVDFRADSGTGYDWMGWTGRRSAALSANGPDLSPGWSDVGRIGLHA